MRRLTIFTLVLAMFTLAFAGGVTYDSSLSTGAKVAPAAAGVKWGGDSSTSVERTQAGVKWGGDSSTSVERTQAGVKWGGDSSTSVERTQAKIELGENQSRRA